MNYYQSKMMLADYTPLLIAYQIHAKGLKEAMFVGDYDEALAEARNKIHAWVDMRAFDMCCQLAFHTDFGKV